MSDPLTTDRIVFHGHLAYRSTPEVWAVIRARHHDQMRVCSSFSDPSGERGAYFCGQGRMETTYSLDGSDYPLIGARTTWDIDPEGKSDRKNEKHEYFLFCIEKENVDG